MKKLILSLLVLFLGLSTYSQTPVQVVTVPGTKYVYVGSLVYEQSSGGNSQKIVVKLLGGSFFADSNGETTFYISNREGLSVKQISMGSYSSGRIDLKAYQNGANIDFYIVPNRYDYTSFAVSAFSFGNGIGNNVINVAVQSTEPAGTDLGTALKIVPIMMTDESGNMGLGTSTPHETLSVNGKIRAKEVKVETSNWPDYVFEEGYKVKTLEELESYIKANKHLPEMPAAKEIEANGIALGEIVKIQQKKIEELTLYTIEKDKQLKNEGLIIKMQQRKIEELEKGYLELKQQLKLLIKQKNK
jgi:hypothetical protein